MVDDALKSLVARYGVKDLLSGSVLLVDDDGPNLDVLGAVLDSSYRVHTALGGAEALGILDRHPVDVIVTDQRMPEMTGVELLAKVRTLRPDVAGIVLTAYTDSPAMMSAINEAGVYRFLTKPWQASAIQDAVARACSHVYQMRAIRRLVDLVSTRNEELARTLDELRATQQMLLHLERLGTMGRLASGVTHDLRNFLMGLSLIEQEVMTREVAPDLRDAVTVGLAGVRNLLHTLETLNQYARNGKLGVAMEPLSPAAVVRDAATVLRMDMEFRLRRFEMRLAPDLPDIVGDHRKLTQVLVNLLRNAVQATTAGQLVAIEATRLPTGGVLIAVEDEGPGVPLPERERLFQAFVSSKGDEGMGMGLYMARLVLESHGGRIGYRDRAGGGARFELHLAYR